MKIAYIRNMDTYILENILYQEYNNIDVKCVYMQNYNIK